MNGLGAVFLSLFGVDASRVLVPCEHILEGSEHMIDNNRPALPARTRTTSAPAGRTLPTRIRYSAVGVSAANGHVRLLVGGQFAPVGRTRFLRISGHENSGSAAAKQLIDTLA